MTTNTNEEDYENAKAKTVMGFLLITIIFVFSHVTWYLSLAPPVWDDFRALQGPYSFLENTLFLIVAILLQSPFACIPALCYAYYSKIEIFISKALLCIKYYFGPYIATFLVYLCIEPTLDLVASTGYKSPEVELRARIVPGLFTTIVFGVALVAVREDCLVVARFFMAQSLMASLYLVREDAPFSAVVAALFPVFLALILTSTTLIPADGLSRRVHMIMLEDKKREKNLHENKVRKEAPKREKIKKGEKLSEEV
ncbi:hypothetical protein LguiA_009210 [Lonicera macranthoides]